MVRFVIRYSLSPFRDWLNRDYGLITRAHGKNVCRLLTGDVWEEAARGDFLIDFQHENLSPDELG